MELISSITDESLAIFQWGAVIGASLVAAYSDLRTRRIPNALTIPLLTVGLLWAAWTGGLSGLAEAAAACILLAIPYVLLFLFAGGGAGDAKLMGSIGVWLGLRQGIVVLFCIATAGILLAIVKAIAKKRLKFVATSVFVSVYTFMLSLRSYKMPRPVSNLTDIEQSVSLDIPYGVAICAGVCGGGLVLWLS